MNILKVSSSTIWIIGVAVGLILGLTIGYFLVRPESDGVAEIEADLTAKIVELEEEIEDLNETRQRGEEELATVKADMEDLRTRLNTVIQERNSVERLLSVTNATLTEILRELDVKKAELEEAREEAQFERGRYERLSRQIITAERSLEQLESGKMLLAELRKEMPSSREETKEYWEGIRSLAAQLDPALTAKVDRIRDNVDGYFDWIESAPGVGSTLEDWGLWLLTAPQGAVDYNQSIDEFLNETYFMIIRDIDAVLEAAG